MTPTLWERISRIVGEAIEQPANERHGFLAQACDNDAELLRQASSLLEAYETPPRVVAAMQGGRKEQRHRPQEIGAYTTEEVVGFGGMGVVYLGRKTDKEVRKPVAIKVLQRVLLSEESLTRFRREREILATLDHPNIARLFDGGSTAHGEPYFVMEYVQGAESLVAYCHRHQLPLRERLNLFLDACAAVQYAHQQMVLHRDLKPSNILVSARGEVKLVDFGLAKNLSPDAGTADHTQPGMLALTPEYASPEQITGGPIGVASDVYSLGVVLYQLMTSAVPFRLGSRSLPEFLQTIVQEQPVKPSLAGGGKRRELAGDLDNIILMALRKEPSRRYTSVEQLTGDIRRHLDGRPVRARRATLPYITHRFLLRHRVASVAAVLLIVSLMGGIVATRRQSRRAEENARRAQQRLQEMRRMATGMIHEVESQLRNQPGLTSVSVSLLTSASQQLELLSRDSHDTELELDLATAYVSLGGLQQSKYQASIGAPMSSRHSFQRARQLATHAQQLRGESVATLNVLARAAAGLGDLASLEGNREEALAEYAWALQTQEKIERIPGTSNSVRGLLPYLGKVAEAHFALGDNDTGLSFLQRAKKLAETEFGKFGYNDQPARDYFISTGQVAQYYIRMNLWDDAIREMSPTVPLFSLPPNGPRCLRDRDRMILESVLGKAYQGKQDYAAAVRHFENGLRIAELGARYDPANLLAQQDLVDMNELLSKALLKHQRYGAAEKHWSMAAKALLKLTKMDYASIKTLSTHVRVAELEASLRMAQANVTGASEAWTRALKHGERLFAAKPTSGIKSELAELYAKAAAFHEVHQRSEEAIRLRAIARKLSGRG